MVGTGLEGLLLLAQLALSAGQLVALALQGLGIELDRGAIEAANALYRQYGLGARDDALAMQFLIPGWTFDDKRPCLVR